MLSFFLHSVAAAIAGYPVCGIDTAAARGTRCGCRARIGRAKQTMSAQSHRDAQRGFTLMELLVVLGIFSMVVTAASDIFLMTNRSQRKVFGLERTQADARFTLEAMAREIRTGVIDYAYYAGRTLPLGTPDTELALIDSTNVPLRFALSSSPAECDRPEAATSPCLTVTINDDPLTTSAITPKGVAVRGVAFYVSPTADPLTFNPLTGAYGADLQPRVTIVLTLASTGGRADERTTLNMQTTVTNRKYRR